MKKNLILVVSIISIFLSGACSSTRSLYSCPGVERKPANNSYFQRLWSRAEIAIYPDPFNPLMQGIESKAFVVTGQDSEYGSGKILAFDTQSGKVLWQRSLATIGHIITGNSQLYTGLPDKIEVIDPQTGNLVKEIQISNVGPIYNIFATEHNLYAYTKSGKWLTYNLDNDTYSLSEPFLPYTPFLIENGIMYVYESGEFKAKETGTQLTLWKYVINEDFDPIFTDNMIILSGQIGSIYGLDKRTGNLLWNVDAHVISNIATNKSQLYFLANDGYLKVLDMNNGREITKLGFVPASFELNSPSSENVIGAYDLWVDSQNDIVVVSFGDSCQLMGIKLQMP